MFSETVGEVSRSCACTQWVLLYASLEHFLLYDYCCLIRAATNFVHLRFTARYLEEYRISVCGIFARVLDFFASPVCSGKGFFTITGHVR